MYLKLSFKIKNLYYKIIFSKIISAKTNYRLKDKYEYSILRNIQFDKIMKKKVYKLNLET